MTLLARIACGAAGLSLLGAAMAQPATVPPRTVRDITALLERQAPDPARIERLKAAAALQPPAGADKTTLVRFYRSRAEAAQGLGLVARQLDDLRLAAELARGTDDEWEVMVDRFLAEVQVGNFATALKLKEQTPALVGKLRGRLIADYQHMVFMYASIGNIDAARAAFEKQQTVLNELSQSSGWGRFGDAWTAHSEAARALVQGAEGKFSDAVATQRRSVEAAKRYFAGAVNAPGAQAERLHFFVWIMQLRLVRFLVLQGQLSEAELEARDVLQSQLGRLGRFAPSTALTVKDLAVVLNEQGRFPEAEVMARAALDIQKAIGTVPAALPSVLARQTLGSALVMQGRWKEGLAAYEALRAAAAGAPDALAGISRGDVNWALALIKSARSTEAVSMLEPLVSLARQQLGESHYKVGEARGFLGLALAENGQRDRALSEYQEAVRILFARARADADEEESGPARARRLGVILEGYLKLLYEMRDAAPQGFDPLSEAFRVADALRGQATQKALAASAARSAVSDPALAQLVRREQDAKQQIAVLYATQLRLLNAPADQQLPQVVAQMRARIRELESDRREIFSSLEQRFPAYFNLIHPRPVTVEEARAALRDGEVLLSLLTASDRTYVWALPKSGPVRFHAAELGEAALARRVRSLRRALDPGEVPLARFPEFDVGSAYRLYEALLKPVEGAWTGAHTLMVAANGALSQLPINVLPTQAAPLPPDAALKFERYKSVPWLIKTVAVAQLPAVSTLATLRALPPGNAARSAFIGFGDPQFGQAPAGESAQPVALRLRSAALPRADEGKPSSWTPYSQLARLPDTRDEILSIARTLKADAQADVYLGPQASKENVRKSDLRSRRIVAFATHGLIPGDFPSPLDVPRGCNLRQPDWALVTDGRCG